MNDIDTIKKRLSIRSYDNTNFTDDHFVLINKIVNKKRIGPNGNEFNFKLIKTNSEELKDFGKMTSYGVVKGTDFFIGGISEGDDKSVIDYGYCFEEVILELTANNIGTCWLGGTFKRSFISNALNLPDSKIIPAISPVGLISENKKFSDKLVRFIAKADKRISYDLLFFKFNELSINSIHFNDIDSNIQTILEMVRIAPSASNKQPWRIVVEDNKLHLFWDVDIKYNSMVKGYNIQALDMGIALCHIVKAANDLGFKTKIDYKEDDRNKSINWTYISTITLES